MIDLQLDVDEGIILQATEVVRYTSREDSLDEMVLTNKNIFYSYEYKSGMFAKTETKIEKIPLDMIKVINGKVQIMKINHDDYGNVMQVLFRDGRREFFEFWDEKKELPKWINAINTAITGDDTPIIEEPKKKEKTGGFFSKGKKEEKHPEVVERVVEKIVYVEKEPTPVLEPTHEESQPTVESRSMHFEEDAEKKRINIGVGAGMFAAGLKNMVDTAKQTFDEASKQFAVPVQEQKDEKVMEPVAEVDSELVRVKETGIVFCSNCGEKLAVGAKFCHGCGSKVNEVTQSQVATPSTPINGQRVQEYVGKIFKCPHCGSVINQSTVICPDCGMRISGVSALSSVQEFSQQLMEIERSRKKSKFSDLYLQSTNPTDTQKLTLIRNFPIPNTIEDVQEFMLLAVANIDVKLSKNTATGKMTSFLNSGNVDLSMGKTISDAWIAKMQQVYQKAELMFPNEPAFIGIQRIYYDKMAELKIRVK